MGEFLLAIVELIAALALLFISELLLQVLTEGQVNAKRRTKPQATSQDESDCP